MGTDYAEKERAFISGLKEDTGRDLTGWMTAITQTQLDNRNDIIDWLRQQGFPFARASWLERIHHNGGRLIYADDQPIGVSGELREDVVAAAETIAKSAVANAAPVFPFAGKPPERERKAAEPSLGAFTPKLVVVNDAPPQTTAVRADVAVVLSAAKGLRPLAEVIISEIERAVDGVKLTAESSMVIFSTGKPFAALLPSAKDLRLFADYGTSPRAKRAEPTKTQTPPFSQVLVLNDVRQINADFADLIKRACGRLKD